MDDGESFSGYAMSWALSVGCQHRKLFLTSCLVIIFVRYIKCGTLFKIVMKVRLRGGQRQTNVLACKVSA